MLTPTKYFVAATLLLLIIVYVLKFFGVSEGVIENTLTGYAMLVAAVWLMLKSLVRKIIEPEILKLIDEHRIVLNIKYKLTCHWDNYGNFKYKQWVFRKDIDYFIKNVIYTRFKKSVVLMAYKRSELTKFIEQNIIDNTGIERENDHEHN